MNRQPLFELNPAESIFAPFHDPRIASQLAFGTASVSGRNFRSEPFWCSTWLAWDDCPAGEEVGSGTLQLEALPDRFDHFIFCQVIPEDVTAQFEAQTGDTWIPLGEPVHGNGKRMEVTRPLPGQAIKAIRILLKTTVRGPANINLQWWGLGDSKLHARLESAKPQYDGRWNGLVHPPEEWGKIHFCRGLLFAEKELPALREKAKLPLWNGHFHEMEKRARQSLESDPLSDLGDFLPWSDYRYLRQREQGRDPWMAEPVLCALVGLIREDRELLRHALHYLMCFVHTRHWCQSAESRARGSTWDQRCFLEEMATTTCSLLYDWLYFALTERGRALVRAALWDKGLSIIQRDMVAHEYIYHINQGPWFCRARLLGGLVLEKDWPRTKPYTQQAFADLQEGMDNYLLPDGGVDEGLGYFSVTLQAVLPALIAYARMRNQDVHEVLPSKLARSGKFVSILSAMEPGGVLLDGDNTNDRLTGDSAALLASLYPEDVYSKIASATLLQLRGDNYYRQYMIDGPFAFISGPEELPQASCIVPVFDRLPHTGHLTSRRTVSPGREVRIHLSGCKARASHTHFDKGAFTVELDREPVLIDRGMIRYDDIRSHTLKRSEMHNVLTPITEGGTLPGQAAPELPVIPEGEGDEQKLHARIDLSHVWREHMQSCSRSLHSDRPANLTIVDEGEWMAPTALAFHLHSRLPWDIDHAGKMAHLKLEGWSLLLEVPWATSLGQKKEGIDHRLKPVWHLSCLFPANGLRFHLESQFTISPR